MRGQFGSIIVNLLFWLLVIGLIIWLVRLYIVGAADTIFSPADSLLG